MIRQYLIPSSHWIIKQLSLSPWGAWNGYPGDLNIPKGPFSYVQLAAGVRDGGLVGARIRSSHNLQVSLQFFLHFLSFLHFLALHFLHFFWGHLSSHSSLEDSKSLLHMYSISYATSDVTFKIPSHPPRQPIVQQLSSMPLGTSSGYPGDLTVPP